MPSHVFAQTKMPAQQMLTDGLRRRGAKIWVLTRRSSSPGRCCGTRCGGMGSGEGQVANKIFTDRPRCVCILAPHFSHMDELLALLRQNARASLEDLARELTSTPEKVAAHIAELEAKGVILGYQTIVDSSKQRSLYTENSALERQRCTKPGVSSTMHDEEGQVS